MSSSECMWFAGKDEAAVLKAKKKRIAEVAGSLKGAAKEHKRQKKKAATAEKGVQPALSLGMIGTTAQTQLPVPQSRVVTNNVQLAPSDC